METVIEINRKRVFSLDDANAILPIIIRLSEDSDRLVRSYTNHLKIYSENKSHPNALALESQINEVIEKWQAKVTKLGAEPKGLWMADFDNGQGYFCWKYPENKIAYHHGYQDGFSGRIML